MKKFIVVALLLALSVSFAFASSLKVPWFVDSGAANGGNPPVNGTTIALVYLTSNSSSDLVCSIQYYNAMGQELGRKAAAPHAAAGSYAGDLYTPNANTFKIPALASIAFRPVADDDPTNATGLQEGGVGRLVPNRGTTLIDGVTPDTKTNGSLVVSWVDGDVTGPAASAPDKAVQGAYQYVKSNTGDGRVVGYGHLLPPGI